MKIVIERFDSLGLELEKYRGMRLVMTCALLLTT